MKLAQETTEATKHDILDKAFARFGHYGFGKTTMAEIAKDCDMSAGNLYRYFENKKEIGAGCARRCMQQKLELVREIVRNKKLNPSKKLQRFTLDILDYMHQQFADQPALMELVDFISRERWDIVQQYMDQERSLLSEILSEGNRSGDFNIPDVLETAKWIQASLIKFIAPRYMDAFPLKELRKEASGVTALLIEGLKA
ncbi:MAG: TetR/AcrR family transcriptional regulator [Nitrospina sp.]|jgi:AcrR family transcriptional regulator|nr:TetR/AcrR family transcriptional regulator [Nitrospina sp.]MBT6718944.1 TetR/AcrR family transcriptional regulator [Nitrospina sp.]